VWYYFFFFFAVFFLAAFLFLAAMIAPPLVVEQIGRGRENPSSSQLCQPDNLTKSIKMEESAQGLASMPRPFVNGAGGDTARGRQYQAGFFMSIDDRTFSYQFSN
jgi:hypothetical protein